METTITKSELKELKRRYNSEDDDDYEFIEWYRRNRGLGWKIKIIPDPKK